MFMLVTAECRSVWFPFISTTHFVLRSFSTKNIDAQKKWMSLSIDAHKPLSNVTLQQYKPSSTAFVDICVKTLTLACALAGARKVGAAETT